MLAPLLHGGWAHLISNSIPFLVLGALVMTYGLRRWIKATGFITVVAGLATWLLARSGNHIGASILVFGYFGFLLGMAWFERSVKSIGIAVVVAVIYGGLIWGVVPTDSGVSWEGHLFGVIAGVAAAGLLTDRSRRRDERRLGWGRRPSSRSRASRSASPVRTRSCSPTRAGPSWTSPSTSS